MIYLVEDDDNIRDLVAYTLNTVGLETKGFSRPSLFWEALEMQMPSMLLLDIMLPEEDGLQILQKLRAKPTTAHLPIIMLTAKSSEFDKVRGLDLGADDYIPKPFGMMELIARIRALLRRAEAVAEKREEYTLDTLYVCPDTHTVKVNETPVSLTLKEFDLLCTLLRNPDVVLTRDQLLNRIWGYAFDGENRTVDVHIRTLRQKLGEVGKRIETVRGIGYKIGSHHES